MDIYICYTDGTVHFKWVHFTVSKLCVNQLDLKGKRKAVEREQLHPRKNKSLITESQALWNVG